MQELLLMPSQDISSLLNCPICYHRYNETTHAPKNIPCKSSHTICSQCITKLLKASKTFTCPFDKEKISLKGKGFQAFTPNLAFKDVISFHSKSQFCEIHSNNQLEVLCMECRTKICARCAKGTHKGHATEFIDEIWKKAETSLVKVQNCVRSLTQIPNKRRVYLEMKETGLINLIIDKVKDCEGDMKEKVENLIEEIQKYISDKKEISALYGYSNNAEIFHWEQETTHELKYLKPKDWETKSESAIPYGLFTQAKKMRKLKVEKWIGDEKEKFEILKLTIENDSDKFIEVATNIIRGVDIGNFDSINEYNLEKIQKKQKMSSENDQIYRDEVEIFKPIENYSYKEASISLANEVENYKFDFINEEILNLQKKNMDFELVQKETFSINGLPVIEKDSDKYNESSTNIVNEVDSCYFGSINEEMSDLVKLQKINSEYVLKEALFLPLRNNIDMFFNEY